MERFSRAPERLDASVHWYMFHSINLLCALHSSFCFVMFTLLGSFLLGISHLHLALPGEDEDDDTTMRTCTTTIPYSLFLVVESQRDPFITNLDASPSPILDSKPLNAVLYLFKGQTPVRISCLLYRSSRYASSHSFVSTYTQKSAWALSKQVRSSCLQY